MDNVPSTKPYLIRALYDWCVDNGFTPYLSVAVDGQTKVPAAFVKDGQITLNISVDATQNLSLGNEEIEFAARFGGVATNIAVPVSRVLAVYARENGVGMGFPVGDESEENGTDDAPGAAPVDEGSKGTATDAGEGGVADQDAAGDGAAPATKRDRPALKRIK